jgi:hypothetical protein
VFRAAATLAAVVAFGVVPGAAHEVPPSAETAWIAAMGDAAKAWLASVASVRGAHHSFPSEARLDWHYVPRARAGLPLRNMTPTQRAAASALLRAALSAKGAEKAEAIMSLQGVLADLEPGTRRWRDPLEYAFAVFGTPGTAPWGWRVEGHHLSVNVTVAAAGHAAMTPLFTGSRPARIPSGPRQGERVQAAEIDLGLAFAQSLDERQFARALLGERSLGDVVTGPGRAQSLARPQGLLVPELTPAERERLLALIEVYVGLAKDEFGRATMAHVRAGLEQTRFAWAGARRAGAPCYYRIHGPRILIEFDNTQNDANHVHALWRDPANDFGRDDLRAHYAAGTHRVPEGR